MLKYEIDLIHPNNNNLIQYDYTNNRYYTNNHIFEENLGIPDFFIDDKKPLTQTQSEFYNDIKFPNYDNIDTFGTLIEKAQKSIFD